MREVVAAESVTELGDVAGKVLVAGSHGGIIAAYLGAKSGAHALILNDAGVGLDAAGIAGLAYLDGIGMAAAAVDCRSARIGDGADMLRRGVISHANDRARRAGLVPGMACREAADHLRAVPPPHSPPPPYSEGRWRVAEGVPEAWALDSVGKVLPEDEGRILLIGSHGALHGGRPESALSVRAAGAAFNDAGLGADGAGITRLAVLDARGIPAVTVGAMSARIGDGRSIWASGVISHANRKALDAGVRCGDAARRFAALLSDAKRN